MTIRSFQGIAHAVALGVFALAPVAAHAQDGDAKAVAVADAVMKAGGGDAGWASAPYMRFTFAVEKDGALRASRTHFWDRVKNRIHVEWTSKDGKSVVCVEYLDSKEGVCSVGDQALFEGEAKNYLDNAYEMWINDTYWLLMPYKMKDAGVHLKYDGEVKEGSTTYDKVLLTFEDVGLTPKDRYWAFVNRQTHRMDKWAYILQDDQGKPGTGDPTTWKWVNWQKYGNVVLSNEKVSVDGKTKILFKDLAVFNDLPDDVFSKSAKVDLTAKP
ncbi:MAG TPA: hypothetical protein VE404_04290 [Verrucomicrobiae bacterium]|nr:hypothetical protein [Verrucomicrobiae bacterium]